MTKSKTVIYKTVNFLFLIRNTPALANISILDVILYVQSEHFISFYYEELGFLVNSAVKFNQKL